MSGANDAGAPRGAGGPGGAEGPGGAGPAGHAAAPGRVTLVGAGPGDPELLTLRAVRAIASADVVLLDDLVDRRVLSHARPDARVVEVGKRGGCASTPQDFIERLMLSEALAGRRVARVKGGDPFVFGRGGEERDWLRAHGVEVEVVPGISSGIAAPAAIGVPVTHRDDVRGVAFVTGHPGAGAPDADWEALARSGLTLVVYMGVARAAAIRARLLAGGLPPTTPAAVVQHATLPRQRALLTTLGTLVEDLAASGLGSPAVIVVGEVVRRADAVALAAGVPTRAAGDARDAPDAPDGRSARSVRTLAIG